MSARDLDVRYLTWLYSQVSSTRTRTGPKTYWNLFHQLFQTEFAWFVPNDDNRAEDGRALRTEWTGEEGIEADHEWLSLGCNFLELLIGLSRRLSFETDGDVSVWFWQLIENLGMSGFTDARYFEAEEVDDITHRVMFRSYDRDGNGGLFPLRRASKDQRKVEIWYQLSEYLLQDS